MPVLEYETLDHICTIFSSMSQYLEETEAKEISDTTRNPLNNYQHLEADPSDENAPLIQIFQSIIEAHHLALSNKKTSEANSSSEHIAKISDLLGLLNKHTKKLKETNNALWERFLSKAEGKKALYHLSMLAYLHNDPWQMVKAFNKTWHPSLITDREIDLLFPNYLSYALLQDEALKETLLKFKSFENNPYIIAYRILVRMIHSNAPWDTILEVFTQFSEKKLPPSPPSAPASIVKMVKLEFAQMIFLLLARYPKEVSKAYKTVGDLITALTTNNYLPEFLNNLPKQTTNQVLILPCYIFKQVMTFESNYLLFPGSNQPLTAWNISLRMQAVNLFLETDQEEELPIEILETALESTLEILNLTRLKSSGTAENSMESGLAVTTHALMFFRRKELLNSPKARLLMSDTDNIISNLFLIKSEAFVTYFLTQKLKYMDSSDPLFAQYQGLLSIVQFIEALSSTDLRRGNMTAIESVLITLNANIKITLGRHVTATTSPNNPTEELTDEDLQEVIAILKGLKTNFIPNRFLEAQQMFCEKLSALLPFIKTIILSFYSPKTKSLFQELAELVALNLGNPVNFSTLKLPPDPAVNSALSPIGKLLFALDKSQEKGEQEFYFSDEFKLDLSNTDGLSPGTKTFFYFLSRLYQLTSTSVHFRNDIVLESKKIAPTCAKIAKKNKQDLTLEQTRTLYQRLLTEGFSYWDNLATQHPEAYSNFLKNSIGSMAFYTMFFKGLSQLRNGWRYSRSLTDFIEALPHESPLDSAFHQYLRVITQIRENTGDSEEIDLPADSETNPYLQVYELINAPQDEDYWSNLSALHKKPLAYPKNLPAFGKKTVQISNALSLILNCERLPANTFGCLTLALQELATNAILPKCFIKDPKFIAELKPEEQLNHLLNQLTEFDHYLFIFKMHYDVHDYSNYFNFNLFNTVKICYDLFKNGLKPQEPSEIKTAERPSLRIPTDILFFLLKAPITFKQVLDRQKEEEKQYFLKIFIEILSYTKKHYDLGKKFYTLLETNIDTLLDLYLNQELYLEACQILSIFITSDTSHPLREQYQALLYLIEFLSSPLSIDNSGISYEFRAIDSTFESKSSKRLKAIANLNPNFIDKHLTTVKLKLGSRILLKANAFIVQLGIYNAESHPSFQKHYEQFKRQILGLAPKFAPKSEDIKALGTRFSNIETQLNIADKKSQGQKKVKKSKNNAVLENPNQASAKPIEPEGLTEEPVGPLEAPETPFDEESVWGDTDPIPRPNPYDSDPLDLSAFATPVLPKRHLFGFNTGSSRIQGEFFKTKNIPRSKVATPIDELGQLLKAVTKAPVLVKGSYVTHLCKGESHPPYSDYDFQTFGPELKDLTEPLKNLEGFKTIKEIPGEHPIIQLMFERGNKLYKCDIAMSPKTDATISQSMRKILAHVDFTISQFYMLIPDKESPYYEIRGPEEAFADLEKELFSPVQTAYGLIKLETEEELNSEYILEHFKGNPGFALIHEGVYFIDENMRASKLEASEPEELQSIFPQRSLILVDAAPAHLRRLTEITNFQLKGYFNLFKTDPRQPFRYLKLKMNHPTFKPNSILQNFLQSINWKEYFNCCLSNPKLKRKNKGRIATSLESLFENFDLLNVLQIMGSDGIFEGLTDIPFAKVTSTLHILNQYRHQAHYTETDSEREVYRSRKIQAYRQRMAFNFFVTTHYRFQEGASEHTQTLLEKFKQWKLSEFVWISNEPESSVMQFILNRLYGVPSKVIVNDPSTIVMLGAIQIEYLKQSPSRYTFHNNPPPAIGYPAEHFTNFNPRT